MYALFFVSVDGQCWPAVLTKVFGNIICNSLGSNENENFGVFGTDLIKVLDQFITLFEVTADVNNLLDVMICRKLHGTDVDLNHILQEILL